MTGGYMPHSYLAHLQYNNQYPDAPFLMEISRNDGAFSDGTFSGKSLGSTASVAGAKEIAEGKFKIA